MHHSHCASGMAIQVCLPAGHQLPTGCLRSVGWAEGCSAFRGVLACWLACWLQVSDWLAAGGRDACALGPAEAYVHVLSSVPHAKLRLEALKIRCAPAPPRQQPWPGLAWAGILICTAHAHACMREGARQEQTRDP